MQGGPRPMTRRSFTPTTPILVAVGVVAATVAASDSLAPPYPPTRIVNAVDRLHGVAVADPYRWLEDGRSPDVKAWEQRQNVCTRAALDKLPGRDKIHD